MKAAMPLPSEFAMGKGKLPAAERLIPFARMTTRFSLARIN